MSAVKFAVVREDEALEASLVQQLDARSIALVASGGCTALSLTARFARLKVLAFDINPAQLAHVQAKAKAACSNDLEQLNVGHDNPEGLNQLGQFEGLFRVLRHFLEEFVVEDLRGLFDPAAQAQLFALPYWTAAFHTAFNQPFLHAMFGPEATQHAPPNSYPGYFQDAFERGLRRKDAAHNPFLQHVLLGGYEPEDAPLYTRRPPAPERLELIRGGLPDVEGLERIDLFSLSNIFDWSDDPLVVSWSQLLKRYAAPGSGLLLRQLNNQRDLRAFFEPEYRFDDELSELLWEQDRSLFYNRVEVAFKKEP